MALSNWNRGFDWDNSDDIDSLIPWGGGRNVFPGDSLANYDPYGLDMVPSVNALTRRNQQLLRNTKNEMQQFNPVLTCNFYETTKDYHVHLDLPGVSPNDLDVTVVGGNLRIKGERKHQFDQDTTFYSKCEKTFGRVQRTIPIPELADAENISVQFNNGVLEISLPKKEEAVSRKLPIS